MQFSLPRAACTALAVGTLHSLALAHTNEISVPSTGAATPVVASGTPVSLYFGDVDGDGLDDVLSIDAQGAVRLLSSVGQGHYEDITLASGLAAIEGASCAVFADFDGDGALDLFVGSSEKRVWRNLGNASFAPIDSGIDHDLVDVAASAVDHDTDGLLDIQLHTEAGDLLYRNLGQGRFERAALPGSDHQVIDTTIETYAPGSVDSTATQVDLSPARRRMQRWQRARNAANLPASTSSTGSGNNGSGAVAPLTTCVHSVIDVVTFGCLDASATPALGRLYPLSTNLNVNGAGSVGMGTTTPLGNMDLVKPSARMRIGATGNNEIATMSLLENNSETAGFDVRYDGVNNLFQIAARDGTATPSPKLSIIRSSGNVGLGTTTPSEKLDVLGNALVSGSVTGNTLASTVATGTAPLTVASTTKVTSLNVDMLDGLDSSAFTQLGNSIESGEITNGTIAMADIGQNGASTGKVIKWNGSAWAPATDTIGSGSQYLSLGPGAFKSDDSNLRIVNNLFEGVWATGGTWIIAPVDLPAGAQVLSVKAYVNDTQGGANLNVSILFKDNASANSFYLGSPIIAFEVLAGAAGFYNQTFTASNAFISGNNAYYVFVNPNGTNWPGNGTLAVQNIVIEWKMP